ncbi:MAG: 3-dehydro-L-gulonate 2-dehydrogenase [Longicatena sp.]
MRIQREELKEIFKKNLMKRGFNEFYAGEAAEVFTQNSLDGIYSHGCNRFPKVMGLLDSKEIDPTALATCEMQLGAWERWDGHRGLGLLNARLAMSRACELAKEHGIGLVALGNNNHWMRGGTYGWQAADAGCIGICWSNTKPNMPIWGGKDACIGNNPFVFAAPRSNGAHVVVDCAVSQFSYGKLEEYRMKNTPLPVPGGYDKQGNITQDAGAVYESKRVLPMGYWKGSGISVLLDVIGTMLTAANSVSDIGGFGKEVGLSQIMIAIDPMKASSAQEIDAIADKILVDIANKEVAEGFDRIYYPGELELCTRRDNEENGIPILDEVWEKLQKL